MKNLNAHRVLKVIRWIPLQFHFFVFWHTIISRTWSMKETFIWSKSLYFCLMIQPNLTFCFCLCLDSWCRGKPIDHNSRKPSLCLNFSSSNNSRYGSASVSNSNLIVRKAPYMLGSTSACLKLWYTFIMNLTVSFSSSKGNLYHRRRLRTPKRVTSNLKDLSCVWCKSYDAHSCLGEKTADIISDMNRTILHQ
jgi:hypothetical protein